MPGVWLHRHDLNRIIERVSTNAGDDFQKQAEDSHSNPHYRRKRKGFLENPFDFD